MLDPKKLQELKRLAETMAGAGEPDTYVEAIRSLVAEVERLSALLKRSPIVLPEGSGVVDYSVTFTEHTPGPTELERLRAEVERVRGERDALRAEKNLGFKPAEDGTTEALQRALAEVERLKREQLDAVKVIAVAVDRAGGEVRIPMESTELPFAGVEISSERDLRTREFVFRTRRT